MGWFDDLADKVGFSSKTLGVNTAEDKAAREKAAQDAADAEYYSADMQRRKQEKIEQDRLAKNKQLDDDYYKRTYGVNADYIKNLDTPKGLQQDRNQAINSSMNDEDAYMRERYDNMNQAIKVKNAGWDQGAYDRGEAMGGWTPAPSMNQEPEKAWYEKGMDWIKENPNFTSAAAQIGSAGAGYLLSDKYYDQAQKTLEDAARLSGTYKDLGISQASTVGENKELTDTQMGVLKKLQGVMDAGQTAEDEAYRRQQQNAVNKQFQARQAQINEDMARRGAQAGSGMSLASSIGSNVASGQQAAEAADADMIRKQQARMDAAKTVASQASSMQQQQFYRDYSKASAADRFNEANVSNLMKAKQTEGQNMGTVAASQAQKGERIGTLAGKTGNVIASAIPGAQPKKESGIVDTISSFANLFNKKP